MMKNQEEMMNIKNLMNLFSAPKGQKVYISSIKESYIRLRMIEMGLYPGKEISVVFRAPFRGPIAIDLGSSILSLREDEANLIEVTNKKTQS